MNSSLNRRAFLNQSLQTALAVGAGTALASASEAAPNPTLEPVAGGRPKT
jgi:hypothetical protein